MGRIHDFLDDPTTPQDIANASACISHRMQQLVRLALEHPCTSQKAMQIWLADEPDGGDDDTYTARLETTAEAIHLKAETALKDL